MAEAILNNRVPSSAMVISAHPDDAEFTCAGTLAIWIRAGCRVVYVLASDGNRGARTATISPNRLAEIRRQEQHRACQMLGVSEVIFLGHDDGTLQADLALRRQLVQVLLRYQPQVVITEDPTVLFFSDDYINHPDHRAIGEAALGAVALACQSPFSSEWGDKVHAVKQVYLIGSTVPDCWADISDTIELKLLALGQHASQIEGGEALEMVLQRDAEAGARHGVAYAEEFRRVTLPWWQMRTT